MEDNIEKKEYLDQDGKATVEVSSSKTKVPFLVYKTLDGFAMYGIKYKDGKETPKALTGRYTKLQWAVEDLTKYIQNMPKTRAVRRDAYAESRTKKV